MSERLLPFFRLTENDQGGVAVVVALCTIVITSTVSAIRSLVASRQRVEFQRDDAAFYLGSFLACATSICIYRAVLAGLGKRIESLSPQSLNSYYKLIYTAQLLSIASMAFSKISVVMLLKRITEILSNSYKFGLVMVVVWGIFSFLALAFQCQLPKPWIFVPSQCKTHGRLQYLVIILNILTDGVLAMGMLPTIWKLNLGRSIRVTVMILFGIRLLVSIMGIGELVFVINSVNNPDQTWAYLTRSVWLMLVTHCSVITATIPRTHSFWASLQSGKAATAITDQEYELSGSSQPSQSHDEISSSRGPFSRLIHKSKRRGDEKGTSSQTDHKRHVSRNRGKGGGEDGKIVHQPSHEPLRLVPRHHANLSTTVYSEGVGSEGMMGGKQDDDTSESSLRQNSTADFGVWREREVVMEVEYVGDGHRAQGSNR